MGNRKGFTLIEVLGVVIVLGIILAIAVSSITKYIRFGTVEYYRSIENEVKASGMDYLETYRTLLPRQIGNVAVIDLKELVDNNYIEEIKDEEGNLCTGKITAKKIDSGTYEYYSCLKCGNSYNSKEENCEYTEYDNTYVDQHLYNITVDNYSYTVNQGDSFVLPLGKVYYNGELINDKLKGNPSKIDTDILGTTEVIYFYNGAKKVVTVKVIDKTKPTKPEVVLKKNNANGPTYLSSTWYSGDIYQLFKSTDYTTPGVMGSGIDKYQISTDGVNFNDLTGNNKIDTQNGSRKYYVRSVDKNNNVSNPNDYVVKIDKVSPECNLKVVDGKMGENNWYISNITVKMTSSDNPTNVENSGVASQSFVYGNTTYTDSVTITDNIQETTINGIVTDNAGNVGTCSINVKVDKTTPTIAAKEANSYILVNTSANITSYFNIVYGHNGGNTTCSLNGSAVSNVNQLSLGVNSVTCTAKGVNGNKASATTTFRHRYYAVYRCSGGRTLNSSNNCTYYYSYNLAQCGCAAYGSCPHADCGVAAYNSCPNSSCGVAAYNSCPHSSCGKACSTSVYASLNACVSNCSGACSAADNGASSVKPYVCSVCYNKSCPNSSCGVASYNSCQNAVCGVAAYNSCVHVACGCAVAASCTKVENNYRYYYCNLTGNNNTNGTLISTNVCSF